MVTIKPADLIVRLDEDQKLLQFLVLRRVSNADELQVFFELSTSEIESAKETTEHLLGVTLMSFLSATYKSEDFGLNRYREAARGMPRTGQRLKKNPTISDPATYQLAMQQIASGLRKKSKIKMEIAEKILREAANSGDQESVEYLRNLWPALKARSDESFK